MILHVFNLEHGLGISRHSPFTLLNVARRGKRPPVRLHGCCWDTFFPVLLVVVEWLKSKSA